MTIIHEIVTVFGASLMLYVIGIVDFSFWAFIFSFLFAFPISTLVAKKFASGQKTMGSHGRYEKTSIVYLYFMVGIVVSSYIGSMVAETLVQSIDPTNFTSLFSLSMVTSFFAYFLMKMGLY